jgi:hypothetical protein
MLVSFFRLQRFQDRLQVRAAEFPIEAIGKCLQVDIGRVHVPEKLAAWLVCNVAGRHGHGEYVLLMTGLRSIHCVLEEDDRVVVGESHAEGTVGDGGPCDFCRRSLLLEPVEVARFRHVPVLAELAGEIASGRAERQHRRTRQEVVQRLFLDGIDAKPAGAAIGGQYHLIAGTGTHETQAALPFMEPAEAGAKVTLQTAVVNRVPVAARNTFDAVALLTDQRGLSHIKTGSQSA